MVSASNILWGNGSCMTLFSGIAVWAFRRESSESSDIKTPPTNSVPGSQHWASPLELAHPLGNRTCHKDHSHNEITRYESTRPCVLYLSEKKHIVQELESCTKPSCFILRGRRAWHNYMVANCTATGTKHVLQALKRNAGDIMIVSDRITIYIWMCIYRTCVGENDVHSILIRIASNRNWPQNCGPLRSNDTFHVLFVLGPSKR